MAKTLIIGFGRSGKDLHLRCLLKLAHPEGNGKPFREEIGVVEPERAPLVDVNVPRLQTFKNISDARGCFDDDTVVHVCTPPSTHLGVLREVARCGYRRIIVEKPLVDGLADLVELRALIKDHGLAIFVVANWLTSSLTARLREAMPRHCGGRWSLIRISQLKPRFTRTLSNPSHKTVFDVEMPHQVALSILLAGADVQVRTADCSQMVVNRTAIPSMGEATITLEDKCGRLIVLHSDLTAPIRQRSVEVTFSDGSRIVGFYPVTEADGFSQLFTFREGHTAMEREILFDDPLSAFFTEVYHHFEEDGGKPVSDVDFHTVVVSTISKAKSACGLRS